MKNPVIYLAVFGIVFGVALNFGGCTYSSGGNDTPLASSDSCDICEMRITPELATLDTGDSLVFDAIFRDDNGNMIDFPPNVQWESSTPNVTIDRYTGFVHVRLPMESEATITGRAHDCFGNIISARARIRKPGPKLH